MTESEHAEDHEHERLSELLRRCRARIAWECASIGSYLRSPIRIGKAFTQEEAAEAVGISRQWYVMLESDRSVRVSAAVLARIADALMMDPTERATLFRLAVPELRSISLNECSTVILEAFRSFRRLTRRLWVATTEAEALTLVREHAMTQLALDLTATATRVGQGWEYAVTGDPDDADRIQRTEALLRERWGEAIIDDLLCYTLMAQPGELITAQERDARFPDLAAKVRPGRDAAARPDVSTAIVQIRSQGGFVARFLALHGRAHAYSEVERAQLSTIADLASIALSGS